MKNWEGECEWQRNMYSEIRGERMRIQESFEMKEPQKP